ncbi:phosphatidylglycerophosphatase A family protein [Hydrogenimonas cancrithermarum]|uniref:Phosphatidylglycerophosphatase A n=1 Tax=Hydrogenimonas cancrithermarum TaxID=2993563 RepID=A0ABN6WX33_9BACT|nr:phosphatidylglycerophosphatase A [Hydrogenimonas cancrithermarum]BDY13824.1 phosphatidylglycerophosphatase A [Hydrogenimonas cancrithermarum]
MNVSEKLFLAGLGSGLLPKAPGTWGTLVGLLIGMAILSYFPIETLFLLTILVTLIGVREINRYELRSGIHDDKRIVIDEVAGIWLALCISGISFPALILSFLFFRTYDIWKPSIIGRIDREAPGGWGVMGDDLVAGAAAGFSSALVMQVLLHYHMLG